MHKNRDKQRCVALAGFARSYSHAPHACDCSQEAAGACLGLYRIVKPTRSAAGGGTDGSVGVMGYFQQPTYSRISLK
jgi:hypothetical protein